MCNNIAQNKISSCVNAKDSKFNDKISDYQEIRPILTRNISAKKLKVGNQHKLKYAKGHPLKLHNGTRIYEIQKTDMGDFSIIVVLYESKGSRKREAIKFLRYKYDKLTEIEKFLEHSQSIHQTYNIDLHRFPDECFN